MLASNQKRDFWTTDDADYVDGDFSIRDIRVIRGQLCLIAFQNVLCFESRE